jgi:hypothetical protein
MGDDGGLIDVAADGRTGAGDAAASAASTGKGSGRGGLHGLRLGTGGDGFLLGRLGLLGWLGLLLLAAALPGLRWRGRLNDGEKHKRRQNRRFHTKSRKVHVEMI